MIWMYVGIVVAILGFAGVLVCAKLAKGNPNIQPVAIACAVFMLAGIGTYGYIYLNKAEFEAAEQAAKQLIFEKALMNKIGTELKGKKIFWFTGDGESENAKAKLEVLKAASGAEVVVVAPKQSEDGMGGMINFKEEIAKVGADDVVLLDTDTMGFEEDLKKAIADPKGCKFAIGASGSGVINILGEKDAQKLFGNKILFVVSSVANADQEYEPSEDNLDEAFSKRYELVKEYDKTKLGVM